MNDDAKQATPVELYQTALNHYSRLSDKACDLHSAIPQALQSHFFMMPKLAAENAALREALEKMVGYAGGHIAALNRLSKDSPELESIIPSIEEARSHAQSLLKAKS